MKYATAMSNRRLLVGLLDEVETITLSYTFFPVTTDGAGEKRDVSWLERHASAKGIN